MNDELKAKLLQYLEVLEEGARKGADLAAEKVPETIHQWVTFSLIYHGLASIALAIVATVLLVIAYKCVIKIKGNDLDSHFYAFPVVFSIIGAAFSIGAASSNAYWALMAWLAPNVFIIKELAALMK